MTFSIAISGKGGTGKTTIAALTIRILAEETGKPILAIDADPNSNLNEALGVPVARSVGDLREALLKEEMPTWRSKEDYLNYMIQSSITEAEAFDLLVMGRPEGPGCYCYVNNLLRKIIDSISKSYPITVMDCEAGLEHLSRRTTRDVDLMLITTDPTARGVMTARRIKDLVKELDIKVGKIYVVANRVPPTLVDKVKGEIAASGLELIGVVPEDPLILEYDFLGKPLINIPRASPAYRSIHEIVGKILEELRLK